MPAQLNQPRVNQPIGTVSNEGSGLVAKMNVWLQQYLKLVGRNPVTTVAPQAVGASPYTYTNNTDFDLTVVITSGTVTLVEFTRDGVNFVNLVAATNTSVTLNPGDAVRITWAVAPIMTIIPR